MKSAVSRVVFRFFLPIAAITLTTSWALASHMSGGGSTSASLSTDTVNVSVGENGNWTINGNDGGSQREFRWSLPSGLNINTGSSSNLYRFRVRSDRGYLQVETNGNGSFSGTVTVSADSSGTYIMENLRAEISLNPDDVTVNVSGASTGGGSSPPPSGGGEAFGNADYTLFIETGTVNITASPDTGNGATTLPVWGYTDAAGGSGSVPGPALESVAGGSFTVEVVNNHNRNHNFVIQGVTSDSTSIPPGGSRIYTVNTPDSGVFLYHDTLNNGVNQALGLFGALVVRPSAGSNQAWSGGPAFNEERLWVVTDMDVPRWNNVANGGGTVNTSVYRPNYFLMNGMNGFQSMGDPATNLEGSVGEVFLVRMVNAGQFDQSLHFHSNHFQVLSRNGNRLSNFEWQDTINLKAGTTAMVLYRLNQPGHYPMHVHTAQMETGNGVYLNGTAAMIIAH